MAAPPTKPMLNKFEPKIFPKTMSGFLILAADTVPATSGKLVPIAIIVDPITNEETPNIDAISTALSTTNWLP